MTAAVTIDGGILVYQQFKKSKSDIKLFDIASRTRINPPGGVNTKKNWEYWPTISGNRILYGRLMDNRARKLILFDMSDGSRKVLDSTTSPDAFLAPGQISGNYAVWHKCPAKGPCDVFRHEISTGTTDQLPNPNDRYLRAASVGPGGTGEPCGSRTYFLAAPLSKSA